MPTNESKRNVAKRTGRREFLTAVGVGALAAGAATAAAPGVSAATDPGAEVRWGFLLDLRRCAGCAACAVVCKTANDVCLGKFRSGVITHEQGTYPNTERHFVPWLCNHCDNPPCVAGCPADPVTGALTFPGGETVEYQAKASYQRPDGLVLVDQDRCIGCGACVVTCPYQARYLDPLVPAGGSPDPTKRAAGKCTLCVHRLENGVVPACVNTCPHEARLVGNLNDPGSEINQRIQAAGSAVSVLMPGLGTEPKVFYIGLNETAYQQGDEPRREAGLQTQIN